MRFAKAGVTAAALLGVVAHQAGWIVFDTTTAVLLALAAVPWAAAFVKRFEIANVGKVEFQELSRRIDRAEGAAESAVRKADLAIAPVPTRSESRSSGPDSPGADLRQLAHRYNEVRVTMESGSTRTAAMTTIVKEMIAAAAADPVDVVSALTSTDQGMRLAAYASIYSHPKDEYLTPLVNAIASEIDRPFGQYWAIQALERVVAESDSHSLPPAAVAALSRYLSNLKPGTDRYYELDNLLRHTAVHA